MPTYKLRTAPDASDFYQAADLTFDQAPTYDEAADPDYDEATQGEFADDFTDTDTDYEDADQEYRPRKQK